MLCSCQGNIYDSWLDAFLTLPKTRKEPESIRFRTHSKVQCVAAHPLYSAFQLVVFVSDMQLTTA